MNNPFISFIVPVYNAASYLPECLDSILAQTYTNYEIVAVNDGSSDDSLEVLRRYEEKHSKLFTVIDQKNGGAASARNNGMDAAKGAYIAFVDGDDVLLPDYLEVMVRNIESDNADLVVSGCLVFDSSTREQVGGRVATDWTVEFSNGIAHVFQYGPWAKLISTSLIRENSLYFIAGEIMEDGPFSMAIDFLSNNCISLPYVGYLYRRHETSVSANVRKTGSNSEKRSFSFNGFSYACEKVLAGRDDRYYRPLEYCICKALAGFVFASSQQAGPEELKLTCSRSKELLDKFFPDIANNKEIRIRNYKSLPLSHRVATSLLRFSYLHNCIYPVARTVQFFDRRLRRRNT